MRILDREVDLGVEIVWVANQVDRCHRSLFCQENLEQAMAYAEDHQQRLVITSALTGEGVERLFDGIRRELEHLEGLSTIKNKKNKARMQ